MQPSCFGSNEDAPLDAASGEFLEEQRQCEWAASLQPIAARLLGPNDMRVLRGRAAALLTKDAIAACSPDAIAALLPEASVPLRVMLSVWSC